MVSFASSITSSSVLNFATASTGPKISSRTYKTRHASVWQMDPRRLQRVKHTIFMSGFTSTKTG